MASYTVNFYCGVASTPDVQIKFGTSNNIVTMSIDSFLITPLENDIVIVSDAGAIPSYLRPPVDNVIGGYILVDNVTLNSSSLGYVTVNSDGSIKIYKSITNDVFLATNSISFGGSKSNLTWLVI